MNTLVVITGPTASGKTAFSVELAELLGADIISADSRQFYEGMKIGTATPGREEMRTVRHHFVSFLSPYQYYSASKYEQDVLKLLERLYTSADTVIMSGGSGLYINAVCEGIDDIPDVDPAVRQKYIDKHLTEGIEVLRQELRIADPEYYARADLKNPRRLIRALEINASTGKPYSSFLKQSRPARNFRIIKTGLRPERQELYERINARVDRMVEDGLVEEARGLYHMRHLNALQTVGYRELFRHFEGELSLGDAISLIKRNSRHYARRQITWWAGDKSIRWFEKPDITEYRDYLREAGVKIRG